MGAVGTCGTLISLVTGLLVGCSSGANIVIARYIGKGDKERVERTIGTSVLFALVAGIGLSVIGITFARIFLTWMNCPDILLDKATLYFRLYLAGVPISMVYNFCASILRSMGDSKRPMVYLTSGGILKIGLNLLFVAVLNLSVLGVALATILSWTFSCVLGLRALCTNQHEYVKLIFSRLRFYKTELLSVLHIGIPTGLQQVLYSIANVIITATVNTFGPAATTGISIANNFDGILYQICLAPALAVMPYVSQNAGAGNLKRASMSVWKGMILTTIFGATLARVRQYFPHNLRLSCRMISKLLSTRNKK